jgi:2-phospho-L-lactate/phosphoenolpyruvate guanylyltransferase
VQATVREFDAETRGGEVLLDDGTVKTFDAAAFDRSGLRLLRSGQRVRLRADTSGTIELITLATFDDPAR